MADASHAVEQLTVFDLPQLHQCPSFSVLSETLADLTRGPSSWASRPDVAATSISEDGVPSYLTRIISSPLQWLTSEEREEIWGLASKRLVDRSGRAAYSSFSRTFPLDECGIEICIHEPSLTGDQLGHKTWGAGYVMAKMITQVIASLPLTDKHGSLGEHMRILELGSGTGLAGIAAAALLPKASVLLTDLPTIVPNLQKNVDANSKASNLADVKVEALDWSNIAHSSSKNDEFDLVLASDSIYDNTHPYLLANAIRHFLRGMNARSFIVLPFRDVHMDFHGRFRQEMIARDLQLLDEGIVNGMDDWNEGETVTFWWCIWSQ